MYLDRAAAQVMLPLLQRRGNELAPCLPVAGALIGEVNVVGADHILGCQEARIREGRWTDPDAGKITVSEWIDRWLAMHDVGISTVETREYLIRRFIRPAWGASELGSLSTEDITRWENAIPDRTGVSRRTARDARALLCTILGDAAAAKPPLIPYNPAIRPRNRGRRTGRRLDRGPRRVWVTPLQALLVAERAALLSGRDEDFTMAYTGLRWAR